MSSVRVNGHVKFYDELKGWGFISRDDGGGDVFVHLSAVRRAGRELLREDQAISFELEPGKGGKGPRAVELQVL